MQGQNWIIGKPDLTELVKKDTLILRCYWTWHYDRFSYHDLMNYLDAFEKYIAIELNSEKPSEVKAGGFRTAYSSNGDDGLGVRKLNTPFFKSVQVFKNHKMQVTTKPGCAEKIAKALLLDCYKEAD